MSKYLVLLLVLVALVSGCSRPESQQHLEIISRLETKACAISCPEESAYPDLQGYVGCPAGTTPICQCSTKSRAMASCERGQ